MPKQSEGESARLLFAEALIDFLKAVMEERSLLLVMDDYHHADEASLSVWHYVARRLESGRLMVLLTTNPASTSADWVPIPSVIVDRGSAETIAMIPMSAEESAELLTIVFERCSTSPSEAERRAIVRAAAGYPMALELIAADWLMHGVNCLALSFMAMTSKFLTTNDGRTGTYGTLVERMLSEISASARQVLYVAAVLGHSLNELEWYTIVSSSIGQVSDGLSELLSRRVLRDVGSGLEFINEVVRACVYRAIPAPIRAALHEAIADRLVDHDKTVTNFGDLEIAWHLVRSGRPSAATPYLLSGARAALIRGAPDRAILAIASGLEEFPDKEKAYAGILLAEAHCELGRWEDCLRTVNAYCRRDSGELDNRGVPLELEALIALGRLDQTSSRAAVDRLLVLRHPNYPTQVLPEAALLAARLCARLRDGSLLEAFLESTREISEALADREVAIVLTARAMAFFHLRRLPDATVLARRAASIASALGAKDRVAAQIRIGLGAIASSIGDYGLAAEHAMHALEIAERLDNLGLKRLVAGNAVVCLCRIGQYTNAIELSRRFAGGTADPWSGGGAESSLYGRCLSLVQLGSYAEAWTDWERGRSLLDCDNQPWLIQLTQLHEADLLWAVGHQKQAMMKVRPVVNGIWTEPLSRGAWGAFARWSTKVATAEDRLNRQNCETIFRNRGQADALDQLEIILASLLCDDKADASLWSERDQLLGQLPATALEQLRCVGAF
jgi:tetratricopeptide (TPR) repeat protein